MLHTNPAKRLTVRDDCTYSEPLLKDTLNKGHNTFKLALEKFNFVWADQRVKVYCIFLKVLFGVTSV